MIDHQAALHEKAIAAQEAGEHLAEKFSDIREVVEDKLDDFDEPPTTLHQWMLAR